MGVLPWMGCVGRVHGGPRGERCAGRRGLCEACPCRVCRLRRVRCMLSRQPGVRRTSACSTIDVALARSGSASPSSGLGLLRSQCALGLARPSRVARSRGTRERVHTVRCILCVWVCVRAAARGRAGRDAREARATLARQRATADRRGSREAAQRESSTHSVHVSTTPRRRFHRTLHTYSHTGLRSSPPRVGTSRS